jgi:hypothetical protein
VDRVRARAALFALLLTGAVLLGGAFHELRHVDTTLQAAVANAHAHEHAKAHRADSRV